MLDHRPGPAARYGAALLAVALAVATRALLTPVLGNHFPFATLLLAVLAAAFYGGSGPAVVAVVAGAVSAAVFLLPSRTFAADGWDQRVGLALFLITGAGIAALGGVMRAARSRAEASAGAAHGERELLHATLVGIGDGVIATDAGGRVTFLNPVAEVLTGWSQAAAAGRPLEQVFHIVNEETRKPVENPALRALKEGQIVGLANHTILISKDGAERPIDDSAAPIRSEAGTVSGAVLVFRDITDRKREEAATAERARLAAFGRDVGLALAGGGSIPEILRGCAGAMVNHLGAAFARVWTHDEAAGVLELRASAGLYTHTDGPHGRVPVGKYKIGKIAAERKPHLTNAVPDDPRVSDQEWARREGMVAFAGYPLVVENRLVGVMAMFARSPLSDATMEAMASVANEVAVGVERRRAQDDADRQREWLRVTLESIGDAVVATDPEGRVAFLNPVARALTGWTPEDAAGRPLDEVFRIVNEGTRQPVENPVTKALREGRVVGLANHTILISKDGSERPIDDSAAPIRDAGGNVAGAVLVFRDVTDQKRREEGNRELLAVIETSTDLIGLAALDGSVRYFNDAGLRMLGLANRDDARTKSLFDFVVPDDLPRVREEMIPAVMRDGQWEGEWRYRNVRTGEHVPISKKVTLIRHPLTGEPVAFSTVSRDISERKRAEADLRRSNARNAAILETALDAIVTCDHEGKVVEFNPAAERMFGYRRADVLGHDLGELIVPPRMRAAHRSGMTRFLATGVTSVLGRRLELTAVRAGGAEFPVELAITPINTDGPTLFTAYLRDISDRVRGERLRAARLAATQALAQAATAGEGITGVLGAVCESLGWDVGAFWTPDGTGEALRCREYWRPPAPAFDEFEAASRRAGLGRGEGLPGLVWASGKPQWVPDVTSAPNFPRAAPAARDGLHGAVACPVAVGGQPLGVMEFFSRGVREPDADLLEMLDTVAAQVGQFVERRAAEEALHRSERELADFFANANVGLHWVGPDGTILRANKAELALLGYAPEEYIGRSITEFHVDEPTICDILGRLKAGEELHDYPARLRCKDGSVKDVLIHSSVLRAGREFVHTRCFTRDVTEQKRAEARLRDETQVTETLYRICGTLAAELDLGRLLQAVTDATTALTGAGFGAFFYNATDDKGEAYLLYTLSGAPREAFERFAHPRATAVFEPTFKGQGTVRLDDVTADPRYGRNAPYRGMPEGHLPVRSYLAVSVKSRTREVIGGLFFGHPEAGVFTERHERLAEGVAAQAAVAIDNARLFEQARLERERARAGERHARFLAAASAALAVLVDYESTLQKVVALAVPGFADWAAVDIAQPDGTLRRLAVAHADPAKVQLAHDLDRRYPPDPAAPVGAYHVLRTGEPEMMADIPDDVLAATAHDAEHLRVIRELGLRSYICVPLAVRGKPLGVLTFVAAESGHRYDAADLTVARDLAHRAAVAVENAELYRELKEADRRKDEFLAMLAHELRNPLAPVRNGLQVLKMRADPGSVERAREMMERQVGHLVRMVDDLMDVSRIMRGKVELRREPVDLATVVGRAVETAQPAIDAAGHELTVALPDEPVRVSGDVVRLTQVLSNLLVNAAKYSERAGRITVTVARVAAEAAVRVKDTGVGIAPSDLSRVFELFAQVDRSISRSQGGLGIGLTLVKRLVELHGGTVTAHSEGTGRGSEFVVRLPVLTESRTAVKDGAESPSAAGPRRRVLVVDDNVDAAESLAMLLRLADHEVRTAPDGPAGLAAAGEFGPDLIVLDIGLPGMTGHEVARRLREMPEFRTTALVAMTGWGQDEDRRRSKEVGFDHHLVKPVDPAVLEELLTSIRPDAGGRD